MATIALRAPLRTLCTGAAAVVAAAACLASTAPASGGLVEVGYSTPAALTKAARRARASVVRVVPALRIALVEGDAGTTRLARELRRSRGISFASKPAARQTAGEPGLTLGVVSTPFGGALEWQYYATAMDRVPADVRAAAVHVKIAVVDTGADLTAPDLVGKVAGTYDVQTGKNTVTDTDGHGTFVASLAAGSDTNGSGMAGFGGNARLLVVKAAASATFNDVDVAAGIVYAARHGARIISLSIAGPSPSAAERRALAYAIARGVLCIAAVANDGATANAPEYPAALLQPVGSDGRGGAGLAVGASGPDGSRAPFSEHGSFVSLAAPGENVFGAISRNAPSEAFPPTAYAAGGGLYGFASGTSFATPEVAGAAALVWAANPKLSATQVALILKETASGRGRWTPDLGYGVIDVAGAVQAAEAQREIDVTSLRRRAPRSTTRRAMARLRPARRRGHPRPGIRRG